MCGPRREIVCESNHRLLGPLGEYLYTAVREILNIAANLVPGGRTLSKISKPDALNTAVNKKSSCDHSNYLHLYSGKSGGVRANGGKIYKIPL